MGKIEVSEELENELKEAAKERGVTVKELVIHVLLTYLEASIDWAEESAEGQDDEDGEPSTEEEN